MNDTIITFTTEFLHENTFSWSLGTACCGECQNLKFVMASLPDVLSIHLSVRNAVSSWMDGVVFRVVSSVESWYVHCSSFFIESPFARPVKRAVAALKKITARGFRNVSVFSSFKGRAAQANLGIFTL